MTDEEKKLAENAHRGTDMVMGCFAYIMLACLVIIVVSLTAKLLIWCFG